MSFLTLLGLFFKRSIIHLQLLHKPSSVLGSKTIDHWTFDHRTFDHLTIDLCGRFITGPLITGRLIHGQLIIKCVKLLSKCVKTTLKLRQNYSTTSLELGSGHRTSPLPWSNDFLKMVINHPVINRPVIKRPVIKRPVINGPRALYWSPSCQPLVSPPAILSFAVRYSGSE